MTKAQAERSDIVVRKAEKLTTATYMVSDIIPDREPVKWKMRETAIELLSDITLSATASSAERLSYLRGVAKKIEKMVSFLDIAWTTRILSQMNASILREEYIALRALIDAELRDLLSGRLEQHSLPMPMYRAKKEERQAPVAHFSREENRSPKAQAEQVVRERTEPQTEPARDRQESAKPPAAGLSEVRPSAAPISPRFPHAYHGQESDSRIGKDDRRKIILALLKQRSKLTVKDIGKSIPGFSEKTIQRELVAMLSEGLVVKEGEKRWTTYSLA